MGRARIPTQTPLSRLGAGLRRFARDRRGVAAIEFAFIVPILLCMYLMTMEVSQGIETNKKLGRAGHMIGDLIAQQPSITVNEVDAIMQIGNSLLQPYNRSQPTFTVTAISISSDKAPRATVLWSRRMADGKFGTGAKKAELVPLPASLLVAGSFLIRVDAALDYQSVLFYNPSGKAVIGLQSAFNSISMGETYFNSARQGSTIPCTGC